MAKKTIKEIQEYYDEHIKGKIGGFINTNARIERAWNTLAEAVRNQPKYILEIGCGIGDICWRMSNIWKESIIKGIDISPKSIEVANKLFSSSNISFVEGIVGTNTFENMSFDLVIMMDVYEHMAQGDRSTLHAAIKGVLSPGGMIFLSFPTPRHLAWLKEFHPNEIQPVDEDISLETILALSKEINKDILLYKEVSVWHQGDYAHAVLGTREWVAESDANIVNISELSIKGAIKSRIKQKISGIKSGMKGQQLLLGKGC